MQRLHLWKESVFDLRRLFSCTQFKAKIENSCKVAAQLTVNYIEITLFDIDRYLSISLLNIHINI